MATTGQLPDWIAINTRRRRALVGTLLAALLLHGLVYFNQRAMFMPWNEAEHPLVAPTPSAFFAQATPTGTTGNAVAGRLATGAAPATPAITFNAPAGATTGGIEDGAVASDASIAGLPDADPLATAASDGAPAGDAGIGTPGVTPAAVGGAPVSFVGPTSVPETSTWVMLLLGFGVIGAVIRQRGWGRERADIA